MAPATSKLHRRAVPASATRVAPHAQHLQQAFLRPAQLDQRPHHLGPVVVRRLVERRVIPGVAVGAGQLGALGDELAQLGSIVGVASRVVQLLVQVRAAGAHRFDLGSCFLFLDLRLVDL